MLFRSEKMRRAYAVLQSIDREGPETEAALYAEAEKARADEEQAAYDKHNLRAVLKSSLQTFATLVPTVDFAAATTQKGGSTVFTNPAYEKKGAVWKACFRAGKAPSQAALAPIPMVGIGTCPVILRASGSATASITSENAPASDRKSTRLNSSHSQQSRMPSSA